MKFGAIATAMLAAGLVTLAGPSHAYLSVNDWRIDLGALGDRSGSGEDNFTGVGVLGAVGVPAGSNGINTMTFNSLYRATGTFSGPAGSPVVGDKFNTDIAGVATSFIGDAGAIPLTSAFKIANFDFELTFVGTTTQQIVNIAVPNVNHTHLGAGAGADGFTLNGYLDVYADVLTGAGNLAGVKANTALVGGGSGMNDGTLIARFKVVSDFPTPSGSFNLAALDGQDNTVFELVNNYFGIVQDSSGNALAVGSTLAFTNSNTDADDDNNGIRDSNPGAGLFAGSCGGVQTNATNCGVEDGSFSLAAQVPEPGSLALAGLALLAVGASRRRAAAR